MKILLVHNFYQYRGGEDTYFLALKSLLESHKHTVITFSKDSRDIKDNITSKINLVIGLFYNKKVKKEFSEILKREKPDIVHSNNLYPLIGLSIYKLSKDLNIPVIQTIHNYRMICPGGYLFNDEGKPCIHASHGFSLRKIFQNCYRGSYIDSTILYLSQNYYKLLGTYSFVDYFLFPSQFILNTHKNYINISLKKARVLPYFTQCKKMTKFTKGNDFFLFVGLFSHKKGVIELLKTFTTLPECKLIVIGDGPLKSDVLKFKKFKNIIIAGKKSKREVGKYMKEALCTIIPSKWYEVGPMVMYESLAYNTPVIVPRIGVFKEVVSEGQNGFFFKFNDFSNLRRKIKMVLEQKNELFKNVPNESLLEHKNTEAEYYRTLISIYKKALEEHFLQLELK
ncbi:MAG: glycosyltransferase [Candidatus Levybacteria bacterium]|nr:glycosyltransferase [Candidatus Levybacteria bacterium]